MNVLPTFAIDRPLTDIKDLDMAYSACLSSVPTCVLKPQTETQRVMDARNSRSVDNMSDYMNTVPSRLRMVDTEEEERYRRLAFGNPFQVSLNNEREK